MKLKFFVSALKLTTQCLKSISALGQSNKAFETEIVKSLYETKLRCPSMRICFLRDLDNLD
jgi:hypothetical protein